MAIQVYPFHVVPTKGNLRYSYRVIDSKGGRTISNHQTLASAVAMADKLNCNRAADPFFGEIISIVDKAFAGSNMTLTQWNHALHQHKHGEREY